MRLELLQKEAPYEFRWPDRAESYETCHRYRIVGGGAVEPGWREESRAPKGIDATGEILVATGWREAFGRQRRRILVFRDQLNVLVEFVGGDRWHETRDVVWQVVQHGSRRNVKRFEDLPAEYRPFEAGPAATWITGPYARSGLAIRLDDDDHAGMVSVAMVRERHKARPQAEPAWAAARSQHAVASPAEAAPSRRPSSTTTGTDLHAIERRLLEFGRTLDPRELFPTLEPGAADLVFEEPFAFALATCLDRGTRAAVIWTVPHYLKKALGELSPATFVSMPQSQLLELLRSMPRRPRYLNDAPRTIKELATIVVCELGGDASRLWRDRLASDVKATLERIHGVGPGIASMAVLLLEKGFGIRFSDVDHRGMDIKPDVHTTRVLYRLGVSAVVSEAAAIQAARTLRPEYPGEVDGSLWVIGRRWCHAAAPQCGECAMGDWCPRVGVGTESRSPIRVRRTSQRTTMDERLAKILDYLNHAKVRATYAAVAEAMGAVPARSLGIMLGERRPEASWVVNTETEEPTGYAREQCHRDLRKNPHVIKSGTELLRCMAGLARPGA